MELAALVDTDVTLPSVPKSVALLLSELARERPDLRKLSQLFAGDPGLTARLLRLANERDDGARDQAADAGATQPGRGIASIAQALALMQPSELRPLASAAALAGSLRTVPGMSLPQFWRYSVNVAKLARSLAAQVRQNQATAYTVGLVHAIGELVLHGARQQDVAALDAQAGPFDLRRARLEQRKLGYCYADVSAELARRWRFPRPIVDALAHQVAPFERDAYEPLAALLNLAAWRARAREAGFDSKALATSFPGEVGLMLGLDIDMVLQQDPFDWHFHTDEEPPA